MPTTPCQPCDCPDRYWRDSQSWRFAVINTLCRLLNVQSSGVNGDGVSVSGALRPYVRAFANVSASQTDANIVTASSSQSIVVVSAAIIAGNASTTVTFNSKSGGAGTAVSCLLANDINGGEVLPFNPAGWFATNSGEGLTVNTSSGSATGILVTYYLL